MSENKGKTRRFLQGTAVLVTSLTGGIAGTTAIGATVPVATASDVQSQPDFIVSPAKPSAQPFQDSHDSHASHESHASHDSHSSHDSHYSGQ